MRRPLRLEPPSTTYHVTSRANRRAAIFVDDEDRQRFFEHSAANTGSLPLFLPSIAEELPEKYDAKNKGTPRPYMNVPFRPAGRLANYPCGKADFACSESPSLGCLTALRAITDTKQPVNRKKILCR